MEGPIRYLLVSDSTEDLRRLRAALSALPGARNLRPVRTLEQATRRLSGNSYAAVFICGAVQVMDRAAVQRLCETAGPAALLWVADDAAPANAEQALRLGLDDIVTHRALTDGTLDHRLQLAGQRAERRHQQQRALRDARQMAENLRAAVSAGDEAVLVVDRGGAVRFANPAAGRLFGCDPRLLVGTCPGLALDPRHPREVAIGRTRADCQVTPIRWDRDQAFLVALRDVSLRKRNERALIFAKQQAEMASEMKSQFLANMSHELRTPLNSILGFAEIMERGVFGTLENERYADYVATIRQSGGHLLTLVNNLLDLSKIEAGREELDESIIDIADLLQAASHAELPTARDHGLALICQVDSQPHLLRADRVKLDQIVLNLLSNAIKFTPQGGRVRLTGGVADDGGYRIAVTDTGRGMTEEEIPRAMGTFEQIRSPFTRKQDRGTGLGLPIARGLAELHQGSLSIISRPGRGTKVTLWLPADRIVDDPFDGSLPAVSAGS